MNRNHTTEDRMTHTSKTLCEWCHKRIARYTAYREVGFGVEVKMAEVCTTCKRRSEGKA